MHAAEANAQTNLSKKRDIMLEMREAKMEKSEAIRFQNLKDEMVNEQERRQGSLLSLRPHQGLEGQRKINNFFYQNKCSKVPLRFSMFPLHATRDRDAAPDYE